MVEIVLIDKPINFDFFYHSKDATTSTVHCKSTGSRPPALVSFLLNLFYFGHRFLAFFSLFRYGEVIIDPPTQNIAILVLLQNSCNEVLEG